MSVYQGAFRIAFPDQPDWPAALRRLPELRAEQVLEAVRAALESWHDHKPVDLRFSDGGGQQFVMEQMALFAAEMEPHEGAGTGFSAVPEGYDGHRSEVRTATVVLDSLGLLEVVGYRLEPRTV